MNVSIVIPVYNEEDYLPACLDALSRQTVKPAEVIVVDNNSSDDIQKIIKKYPFVRIITEPRQGIVLARNTGFRSAKSDIIARIDADTRVPSDWVANVAKAFEDNLDVAAVTGPPLFYEVWLARIANTLQILNYQRFQKLLTGSYTLWGANMAIRRDAWQTVNPICSERVDINEDIDLSFCLRKRGLSIRYVPDLKAQASFNRNRVGLRYTVRYFASWPRDYRLHQMYLRAVLLTVLIIIGLLIALPVLVILSLKSHLAD